jgi:aspartate aminotransferase
MKLSQRISAIGASPTIAITGRAAQLKAEGVDVVSFGAGEPDFDTPDFIKQAAIEALRAGDTKYTPRSGKKLLQAIADKQTRETGVPTAPENVAVTFGGKHALACACQVLLDPGDKALIPAPYWVSYPEMVKIAGAQPLILETSPESGFKITPRQILDAAGQAKILFLNSPSNPTGVTYTPDELAALAQAVLQTDLLVFSDEIYEKLIYGDMRFVSFASLDPKLHERTLTFNGLSKTYSMTGWRLGWVTGPADAVKAIGNLMSHQTTKPVSFAQAGALAAYTDPRAPQAVEEMRSAFQQRAQHMARRLNELPGVACPQPTGAFYCFPDVSQTYGRTVGDIEINDSMSFAKAALEGFNVALVPGVAFGQDRCIRLSFATSMEQIDKGIDRLAKMLA